MAKLERDVLILIEPGFADAAYGGPQGLGAEQAYYCPYCAAIEGVLAIYPELGKRIDVIRAPFARPRTAVIDLIGEDNQTLPKLVLAGDVAEGVATGQHGGVSFVSGHEAILRVLAARHGIAYPHF